jgi:uncharacterized protein HemX
MQLGAMIAWIIVTITKFITFSNVRLSRVALGVCALIVAIAGSLQFANSVYAVDYDGQLNALQNQVNQLQGKANDGRKKGHTSSA